MVGLACWKHNVFNDGVADRRRRRSGEQVVAAIRAAALAELGDRGYASLTLEGVAGRAGVSKPVLYRRYQSRVDLVFDALQDAGAALEPLESAGELRADLIAWVGAAADRAMSLGPGAYRGMVGEAGQATLRRLGGVVTGVAEKLSRQVLEPARERGELGPASLPSAVVMIPLEVLRDRILFDGDAGSVEEIVDRVAMPVYRAASGAA